MRLAISTTETLTDLKTDLVVANNNNNIELGMLVMYCMQFVMSVSVVSMVSCCGVAVFLGAMYMLAMVMSLKCFVCIFRSCVSVLSVLMVCGVLMCVNVVSDLM